MEKEKYEPVELEIIVFDAEDVITESKEKPILSPELP